jgi:hypothetical protein
MLVGGDEECSGLAGPKYTHLRNRNTRRHTSCHGEWVVRFVLVCDVLSLVRFLNSILGTRVSESFAHDMDRCLNGSQHHHAAGLTLRCFHTSMCMRARQHSVDEALCLGVYVSFGTDWAVRMPRFGPGDIRDRDTIDDDQGHKLQCICRTHEPHVHARQPPAVCRVVGQLLATFQPSKSLRAFEPSCRAQRKKPWNSN